MKTNPLPWLTSEQKQLQRESSKSVIVADMDGNVVAFNPGAANVFGYSETEMIGKHVRVFHPPQNFARILPELFRTALQKGKYDAIIPLVRKSGEEFPGHIVVTQVRDDKKNIVGLMGVTEEAASIPGATRVQRWVQALRAPFFSATLIPLFLGTSIAFSQTGLFSFWSFFWTVLGMLCIHAGVNLANDYFDHRSGNDALNGNPTPFSGGSRVIQEGLIPASQIRMAFLLFLAAGAGIGLYLNSIVPGDTILFLGVAGMAIGYFYSSPPFAASYHRLGELVVMVGFGPLIVYGSYFVQAHVFSWTPLLASVPVALLIGLVLFLNEFPDFEADVKSRKRNVVNTIGKEASTMMLTFVLLVVFAFMLFGVAMRWFPLISLITLAGLPYAWTVVRVTRENKDRILELLPANAAMIKLNFVFGALFTMSFLALNSGALTG